ncbi:type VI secretion system baseplate subunit TssK [Pseudoxanthomonas putridarboris]|uniref:Type VI secretion system baseplate subunit TssK n=1 Tax=Pseudoxanthomonas putridarboris TaxID=752605 RepID=A0ABU9J6T5_9GAMM
MSSRSPVVWKEGLFVKPQHFQQEARYFEHHVHQRVSGVGQYLYGFSELELNSEYLSFGKIALLRARGVMPDGSVFEIPAETPSPSPLTISDISAVNQTVYLALPLRSEGALEVQWPETYAHRRYAAGQTEIKDVHSEDGDHVTIDVAKFNFQLMLERDDRSAFTSIPMARILDRRPDGSLVLDEAHYATAMSINAVPTLSRFLGEVAGLMRERAKNIAERIGSPAQSGVADITDFNLLQALNRMHPLFQHLARSRHLHPEELYRAFCQACGELVTFTDEGRLPAEYPAYQHENLRESFRTLEETLRRTLSTVLQPRAVSIPIIKQKFGVLSAAVQDRRLIENAEFILAVRARMPLERLRQVFVQQAKLASIEKINSLVNLQLPGIPLIPLPVAPRHLPYHAGFTYFQLDRGNPAWQMMRDTAGFSFHISGDFPELEMQLWAIRSQ